MTLEVDRSEGGLIGKVREEFRACHGCEIIKQGLAHAAEPVLVP